jgi:uncharacterized protein (TIGR04141 family)
MVQVPRQPRQNKLTWSLLKKGVTRNDALRDVTALSAHIVPAYSTQAPSLFVTARLPHPPWWVEFLNKHVRDDLTGLVSASSAVLFVETSDRLFAVTFGQGRHLLHPEACESDFGLKVVLNTVAPDQLKSVDAKTIDETTMHTRRDVSRDSPFSAFGLDVSRDLLRAVTGTPQDEALGPRLTGADALGLWTRLSVPDLHSLAERLAQEYTSESYKKDFDFVDFLRPEKSPARLRELEELLVDALRKGEIQDVHLAAPEPLDWLDIAGFKFTTQPSDAPTENDPRITTYLATRKEDDFSLRALKDDHLLALRASDGEPQGDWQILRCVVYQTELEGQLYVLSAGDWFRVNLDFKERVYEDVHRLSVLNGLPAADGGTDEDTYNKKAAAAIDGLCLDRKFVYESGPDKTEICDILTRDGGLIHVKHRGSSSTLSHLFTQGLNSAERLLQDADFRSEARRIATTENEKFADVLPADRPAPESHEVVVITRSKRDTPLTLPFFSLVSLRAAAFRLRGLGFPVSVAAVRELEP